MNYRRRIGIVHALRRATRRVRSRRLLLVSLEERSITLLQSRLTLECKVSLSSMHPLLKLENTRVPLSESTLCLCTNSVAAAPRRRLRRTAFPNSYVLDDRSNTCNDGLYQSRLALLIAGTPILIVLLSCSHARAVCKNPPRYRGTTKALFFDCTSSAVRKDVSDSKQLIAYRIQLSEALHYLMLSCR